MPTVTGYTAERMKEIEDNAIVSGEVVGDDLILERNDTTTFVAGNVRGPQGAQGPVGEVEEAPNDGKGYVRRGEAWFDTTLFTVVTVKTTTSFSGNSTTTGSFNFPADTFSNSPHPVGVVAIAPSGFTSAVAAHITALTNGACSYRTKMQLTDTGDVDLYFTFIDYNHATTAKKGKWTTLTL